MSKIPKPGQTSVSIPQYIWDYAETYFNEHEEELKEKGIRSVTRLICIWIQETALREHVKN